MASSETLYEQLGGRERIEAVVDEFYDRVLADPRLEPYFEEMDMVQLRAHQTQFLSAVTGGPGEYSREGIRDAHAPLDLDESEFDAVAIHLAEALGEEGVEGKRIERVLDEVAAYRDAVIGS